jgi:hypothetical protein
MNRLRRAVLWAALIAIVLLALLSIYGAFLGAERARAFFGSLPLAFYWFALAALLVVGIVLFRRLLRVPSLLLLHFGCILVLAGGMWGSKAGFALQKQFFGLDRIPKGLMRMEISDRTPQNRVAFEDGNETRELPFSVRLKAFRLEYYSPGYLLIRSRDGKTWKLPVAKGAQVSLGESGQVTVERVFENFKLAVEEGKHVAYDAPGDSNPALQVRVRKPDGTTSAGLVFLQFEPMFAEPVDLKLSYRRTQARAIKDYISELEVVRDGKVVAAKAIEVNHPLHYGGYHFYQHSLDKDERGQYTILQVVSDAGLNLVYGGYLLLVAGVFWHFWGRRLVTALKSRHLMAPATNETAPEVAGQHG